MNFSLQEVNSAARTMLHKITCVIIALSDVTNDASDYSKTTQGLRHIALVNFER